MKAMMQRGFTFLELLVVIAIVGLIAMVAMPSSTSGDAARLDLATAEVADAVRFAREESRHTGFIHGVSIDLANNRVRVFRLDEAPDPNLKVFDVYQPISKQLYTIQLGASPYGGVQLNELGGDMLGPCTDPGNIAFDSGGVVRCVEPVATRITEAVIELELGGLGLTISIDDYTGRVSIE